MSLVKCAYHKCDEEFIPVRKDHKYHDKSCKKKDHNEKSDYHKKVFTGKCEICKCTIRRVGRNPEPHCADCRKEIRAVMFADYDDGYDGEEMVFDKTCANCKFGKPNTDATYGYECLARKAVECKAFFLQTPKFWTEAN